MSLLGNAPHIWVQKDEAGLARAYLDHALERIKREYGNLITHREALLVCPRCESAVIEDRGFSLHGTAVCISCGYRGPVDKMRTVTYHARTVSLHGDRDQPLTEDEKDILARRGIFVKE